ncbi:MAG TPA: hypothetical protein VEI28_04660 [Thermodesulfovibrionales bacterium]|nr:hypothetical protein [Thermodesulfovibrionales bacterium]
MFGSLVLFFVSLVMFFPAWNTPGAEEKTYEQPPINRKVTDILPADKIKGEHYKVLDSVVVSGNMDHYSVDSDYGFFEVTGDGLLKKRLKEIQAMAILQKIEGTDAFQKALKAAAMSPVKFGENLVTDPVDTVSAIPKGVGQMFSNAYASITTKRQAGEDSSAEALAGLSKYKREYAYNLGVDVYSSNPVFQKELNKVAWAASAGSLTFSAAMAPLGAAGAVISYSKFGNDVSDYLRDNPPSQIRRNAQDKLSSMRISNADIKKFIENKNFTPRHTVVIVASLTQLRAVKGRDAFIRYVSTAADEEQANFMMNVAQILRGYHEKVSPIKEITINSGFVMASARSNSVLIPLPIDYGVWTEKAEKILTNMITTYKSPAAKAHFELWLTGTASPIAKKSAETLGITLTDYADTKMDFVD